MKEVKKCSISGVAFTMDADAYQELENYLDSLKKTYKDTPDGAEIVAGISVSGPVSRVTPERVPAIAAAVVEAAAAVSAALGARPIRPPSG